MEIVIGVDPGVSGAFCIVERRGLVDYLDMPTRPTGPKGRAQVCPVGVKEFLDEFPYPCFVEHVGPMPRDGAVSAFCFGYSFGVLCSLIEANGHGMQLVRPQAWKRKMDLIGKPKDASRSLARNLVPGAADILTRKKDAGRADALLIGLYGLQHGQVISPALKCA